MKRIDSLRHDLVGIRRFARRLKDDEHNDPLPPPLPSARVVAVPERGEMFLRQLDGPPEGPTIVLLHGWALSADVNWFCGLYDTAASHGDVLAPDMRGHGRGMRSDGPLTLEMMADDVAALVEHLDLGPVVLVGYSLGGSLSLLLWRHHRRLISGMVLISTALRWRTSLREVHLELDGSGRVRASLGGAGGGDGGPLPAYGRGTVARARALQAVGEGGDASG